MAGLRWGWNWVTRSAQLSEQHLAGYLDWHECEQMKLAMKVSGIQTGGCKWCKTADLLWFEQPNGMFQLTETFGLPHVCDEMKLANEEVQESNQVLPGQCKYCKTPDLTYVRQGRLQLRDRDGQQHKCDEYRAIWTAHKAALREDYAFEKKWLKSVPDDYKCKKCKGTCYIRRKRKDRETQRRCKPCRGMGTFTAHAKREYLKALRKAYWPFNSAYMKWPGNHD